MPSPAVAAALDRMDQKAGCHSRRSLAPPAEPYGVKQLAADLRNDRCPVHGCDLPNPGHNLMCRGHWRLVPAEARREVYEAVRSLNRLGKRYDAAPDGQGQRRRLADLYLAAEATMRDVQLQAVILASERAGARPS